MTALDQILIGIENLKISPSKKHEYMLEILYVNTDEKQSEMFGFTCQSRGLPAVDLNHAFWWGKTTKNVHYWGDLNKQLLMNNES